MSTEPADRVGEFALRHRAAAGAVWLLVLLLGGVAAVAGLGRLDQSFTASGGPGHRANQAVHERYGNGAAVAPLVAVVTWPAGTDVRARATGERLAEALAASAGRGARTVSYADTGDEGFLGADGRTVYALVYPGAGEPDLAGLAAVEETAGSLRAGLRSALPEARTGVTGVLPLQHDSALAGPGAAALVAKAACALGLLVLLALAFRSALGVLAPLLLAAVTSVGALVLVEAVAGFTGVSFVVVYLVPVTALVVAVHRWAQPPGAGARSAVTGGAAGAAAFAVLALFPVSFLRSIGIAGAAVCLVGIATSLTLAPVLRSVVPRPAARGTRPARDAPAVPRPARNAFAVPRPLAAAGLVLLVLLAGAATQLRVGNPEARALVESGPSLDGLERLGAAGVPSGVLNPLEVLVPEDADAEAVAARAARVPGVLLAAAPEAAGWRRSGTALVVVVPVAEPMTAAGAGTVAALRSAFAGSGVLVGGSGVVDPDLVEGVYGLLPYAVPLAALAAFGVLVRRTRAPGAAARSVCGALLAAGVSAGGLVVVWQWGPADTGAVTGWVPLVVGAFAFCVSLERSTASAAGGPGRAGPVAAGAGALAVLAVGIGPQVELALLVSGFAMGAVGDALAGRARVRPEAGRWSVHRNATRLV
ncbi:MMPL family transporter [Streptomyces cinereoruber]|uniref:MMPL family transporter n=1 Tax=Streptomyces cinereoruber TaxID=67260 RepID=UPI00363AD311